MPTPRNVSFTAPYDLEAEQEALERQRRLAEALQTQSMQPIDPNRSAGFGGYQFTVPVTWTEGLAKLAQAYVSGKQLKDVEGRRRQIGEETTRREQEWAGQMPKEREEVFPQSPEFVGPEWQRTVQPTSQDLAGWMMKAPTQRAAGMGNLMYQAAERSQARSDVATQRAEDREARLAAQREATEARKETATARIEAEKQARLDRAAQDERMARLTAGLRQQPAPMGGKVGPGQSAVDREFAREYVEWSGGGMADVEKNLNQLRSVSKALETEQISGAVLGNLPDWARASFAPKSMEVQEAIQEVAQRNLRQVLGGQFAQKEGEQLIARVYNPRLPESINKKRLDRLITQIDQAARDKASAAEYFEQNGTLSGWKGRKWTLDDFDPDRKGAEPAKQRPDDDLMQRADRIIGG